MAACALVRRGDGHRVHADRRTLMPRSRAARDVPTEVRNRRERDGRGCDRKADRRGLAHVIPRHPGVGEAQREGESGDQNSGEDTRVLTTEWPAESG